ncbi:MAG: GNAT family N-acetyltransferase [Proteobacteria bacterium]|nr:GNAT family N-acetyltransferase [Pseudomonadota bacterium]
MLKKRPGIVVREMEIDDLAAVFHLGEKLFTARSVPNLYRTWDEHEIVQLFDSDRELCLVAESDDRIVGFALGTTVEKDRSAWKYGLLTWMGVAPDLQRAGVGDRLFRQIRERMEKMGVNMMIIDTESDNLPGLHFFRKLGFGKPEEHIYLSLNLSGQKKAGNHKKENGST